MTPSKAKETKIQSIPTSVVTISTPTSSTVASLTGGQAIQQHITMMQHQQLRKQQQQNQLIQEQKNQLHSLMDQQKSIITKNECQLEHDSDQQNKNQLQTLLDMQKSIIITNHTQQQNQAAMQQITDHHILQGSQESLPITILRTSSQNIGINSGIPIHQLSTSTDQHSIVY